MSSAIHCFKIHKNLFTSEEKKALRSEAKTLAAKKNVSSREALVQVVRAHRDELQRECDGIAKVIRKHYGVSEVKAAPPVRRAPSAKIKKEIPSVKAKKEPIAKPTKKVKDEEKAPDIRLSKRAGMYSALTRAAESPKFPAKLPAKSVINQLKKGTGVKQIEIDVSGLAEWLEGKDKVSKADLVDFLKMNEAKIKETEKGEEAIDVTRGRAAEIFDEWVDEEVARIEEDIGEEADWEDVSNQLNYDEAYRQAEEENSPKKSIVSPVERKAAIAK
jgi:hypothetical protein